MSITKTEDRVTNDELATLDEETKTTLQIDEIHRRTVRPGMMKLAVKRVSTSEENHKVVIDVEHPLDGEVRFHLDKPKTWTPDNELVEFLNWYGLNMSHVYQLQTHDVYVEQADTRKGWTLVRPPDDHSLLERVKSRVGSMLPAIELKDNKLPWVMSVMAMVVVVPSFVSWLGLIGSPGSVVIGAVLLGFFTPVLFIAWLMVTALIFGAPPDD